MQIYLNILINVITIIFYLLAGWTIMGYIQRIKKLESKIENLQSSIHKIYVHNAEIRKLLGIEMSFYSYVDDLDQPTYPLFNFNKLPIYKDIDEIKSILKEAGIIIEPPANISVPDPRGYSIKKVK